MHRYNENYSEQDVFHRVFWTFVAGNSGIALVLLYFLQVFLQDRFPAAEKRFILGLVLVTLVISVILSATILAWVLRYVVAPLRAMLHWAKHVDNLEQVTLDPYATQEVVATSRVLNEAIERLQASEKKHQESKIQNEKAKLSQQLAHDLRAPLSTLQVLVDQLEGKDVPHFELIKSCSSRISDIADGLVKGSTPKTEELVSVEKVVSSIIREKEMHHQGMVKIHFERPVQDIFVSLSAVELGRILSNTLDNSIEAIRSQKKGKSISVKVRVEDLKDGGNVHLTVVDDGPGIPRKVIRQVGRRGRTFGKINGNGIGLYNCRRIVRTAGGTLKIRSDGKSGTTVNIRLPMRPLH